MDPDNKSFVSREVCCCGARCWSLVIAWFQTIACAILAIVMASLVIILRDGNSNHVDDSETLRLAIIAAVFVSLLVQFAAGLVLIVGCKQESAGKLKFWSVIQIIFLVLNILCLNIVGIAVGGFFIWVVNIYRQEILCSELSSEKV